MFHIIKNGQFYLMDFLEKDEISVDKTGKPYNGIVIKFCYDKESSCLNPDNTLKFVFKSSGYTYSYDINQDFKKQYCVSWYDQFIRLLNKAVVIKDGSCKEINLTEYPSLKDFAGVLDEGTVQFEFEFNRKVLNPMNLANFILAHDYTMVTKTYSIHTTYRGKECYIPMVNGYMNYDSEAGGLVLEDSMDGITDFIDEAVSVASFFIEPDDYYGMDYYSLKLHPVDLSDLLIFNPHAKLKIYYDEDGKRSKIIPLTDFDAIDAVGPFSHVGIPDFNSLPVTRDNDIDKIIANKDDFEHFEFPSLQYTLFVQSFQF